MSKPKRIQRKRTKGWRMPEGAVYVGRPSKWGNHYQVKKYGLVYDVLMGDMFVGQATGEEAARGMATKRFESWLMGRNGDLFRQWARAELAGRDLACWCPLDQPCHADVLLRIANERESA